MNPVKRFIGAVLRLFEHKRIHAFHIRFEGQIYYVCARCAGLYLGVLVGFPSSLVLIFLISTLHILGDLLSTLIALLFALPTILDWTTQRLALRESTNPLRFISAFLAGFALAWYLIVPISLLTKLLFLVVVFSFIGLFSFIDRRPLRQRIELKEDNKF